MMKLRRISNLLILFCGNSINKNIVGFILSNFTGPVFPLKITLPLMKSAAKELPKFIQISRMKIFNAILKLIEKNPVIIIALHTKKFILNIFRFIRL